jgi:DNA-binding transcriptional ArsR family regulator
MAVLTAPKRLDLQTTDVTLARAAIAQLLKANPSSKNQIYAALVHLVWSLVAERRLEPEIRDWHDLIQRVKGRLVDDDRRMSERLGALADVLRESIHLADTMPATTAAASPRARRVMEALGTEFIPRRKLLEVTGLGGSNLSNILTKLLVHNLVERRGEGKEGHYRLTPAGAKAIGRSTQSASTADLNAMIESLAEPLIKVAHHSSNVFASLEPVWTWTDAQETLDILLPQRALGGNQIKFSHFAFGADDRSRRSHAISHHPRP